MNHEEDKVTSWLFWGMIIGIVVSFLICIYANGQPPGQPQLQRRTEPKLAAESCRDHLQRDKRALINTLEADIIVLGSDALADEMRDLLYQVKLDPSFTESKENCTKQSLGGLDVTVALIQLILAQDVEAVHDRQLRVK
jgi:hypothetical protein